MKAPDSGTPALSIEGVTVRSGGAVACSDVSLAVPRGAIYALLGRTGSGRSQLVGAIAGDLRVAAGRIRILGQEASSRRQLRSSVGRVSEQTGPGPLVRLERLLRRRFSLFTPRLAPGLRERLDRLRIPLDRPLGQLSPAERSRALLALALASEPTLLVLEDPRFGPAPAERAALKSELREAVSGRDLAVLIATGDPGEAEGVADRVGILHAGRMVLEEEIGRLQRRFRRIRYRNEITATRSEYGTELDDFDAVRVRARGWGVEAIVSNYSQDSFERFQRRDGVVDAEAIELTLAEIFDAVAPERGRGG